MASLGCSHQSPISEAGVWKMTLRCRGICSQRRSRPKQKRAVQLLAKRMAARRTRSFPQLGSRWSCIRPARFRDAGSPKGMEVWSRLSDITTVCNAMLSGQRRLPLEKAIHECTRTSEVGVHYCRCPTDESLHCNLKRFRSAAGFKTTAAFDLFRPKEEQRCKQLVGTELRLWKGAIFERK